MLVSSQEKKAASQMMPYLITSAMPAANSRAGRVLRQSVSMITHAWADRRHPPCSCRGMVDGGLAADGRVNLGEQRGRHLNKRNASLVACRSKADNIAYHTAPRAIRVVSRPWLVSSRADMIRLKVARVL